jgi:hypothetical protein
VLFVLKRGDMIYFELTSRTASVVIDAPGVGVACGVPNAMRGRDNRHCGSEGGPVILPVFKTGERQVRPVSGAFDSHTLPPIVAVFC